MSNRTRSKGARRCGAVLAVGLATLAVPVASAVAEPVLLGTTADYSVLGGSTVTNTGPSVLSGDLGVYPGNALPGFGPATINGTVHAGDADAGQAQTDLTTAYGVAAGQTTPVPQVLTGNLAGRTLLPGNYSFATDAALSASAPLVLDDQGDPAAQFVFNIPGELVTASDSSVVGVSGCNVYWRVGSQATLGTGTDFLGNIMADQSISLNTGASLIGRALARIGQVSLDNNVVNAGPCGARTTADTTGGTTSPTTGTPVPGAPLPTGNGNQPPPASRTTRRLRRGTSTLRRTRAPAPGATCTDGFTARVRGAYVKSVVFRLDGKRIVTKRRSPFSAYVKAAGAGKHKVTAKVTYKDATRAVTRTLRYRGCAAAVLQPRRGPSQFTG